MPSEASTNGEKRSSSARRRSRSPPKRARRRSPSPPSRGASSKRKRSRTPPPSTTELEEGEFKVPAVPPVKKEPLSLEEVIAKRNADLALSEKTVFLTKAQRAELALEKRTAEIADVRAKQTAEREARDKFMKEAARSGDSSRRRGDYDRGGRDSRDSRGGDRRHEPRERGASSSSPSRVRSCRSTRARHCVE